MEVPAAHLDDRAEAAIERAPPRSLDDVDLLAEEGIALQHPRPPVRQAERVRGEAENRPGRVAHDAPVGSVRQPGHPPEVPAPFEFPQQFAPGKVRIRCENQAFVLRPSPFRRCDSDPEVSLAVEARRFPCHATTTLPFLLW